MSLNMIPKDVRNILKPHLVSGTIRLEKGKRHARVVRVDNGRLITVAGTSSDWRSITQFRLDLEKLLAAPVDYTGNLRLISRK